MPPVTFAVAPPLDKPLQLTLLSTPTDTTNIAGSVTVELLVLVQPLASVMVTEYIPATTPVMLAVVAALLQTYE